MPLPDNTVVTVCDACQKASCWHWKFPCEAARAAGTKQMTVGELRKLELEHEDYWDIDPATGVARTA
jgi:hypothetical protein